MMSITTVLLSLKKTVLNHPTSSDAIKEPVEENNHVAIVPNSSCDDVISSVCSNSVLAENCYDDVASPVLTPEGDTDNTTSNISESQKDSSFCQNDSVSQDDSGVKVDVESDISDSKYTTSSQTRTGYCGVTDSEMHDVHKTADKLDSAYSMMAVPDSNDQHHHSDCSSSSRSSKDMYMDAQEDISNETCTITCEVDNADDVSMLKKDDSGIDIGKSPGKSPVTKSTERANSIEASALLSEPCEAGTSDRPSLSSRSERLEECFQTSTELPELSRTSQTDRPAVSKESEGLLADFDTSSDAGMDIMEVEIHLKAKMFGVLL